ncbi:winged helix-turn-helix domain-containing protein [Metallosphaera hakonensis]|uniref:Transcriptional regulator n=1 Tax=Metallosphaera hakonensis JCM 8857 = DSM 7519 TaxID=1293036 RepID=A0A2U9IWA5_9CREN|nr:winged helix-turn-helix domain-containing protein [Metallosphaera hakonensis]AWS00362.1 transcriptional regulator [Metallosphaera hakonensis JCM 8857 = DSM 7519]
MPGKRRGKLEIYADILTVCSLGGRKTEIMYRANLSYELLTKYLKELEEGHFISNKDNVKCLTEKGERLLNLLNKWRKIREEIEDVEFKIAVLTAKKIRTEEIELKNTN